MHFDLLDPAVYLTRRQPALAAGGPAGIEIYCARFRIPPFDGDPRVVVGREGWTRFGACPWTGSWEGHVDVGKCTASEPVPLEERIFGELHFYKK